MSLGATFFEVLPQQKGWDRGRWVGAPYRKPLIRLGALRT